MSSWVAAIPPPPSYLPGAPPLFSSFSARPFTLDMRTSSYPRNSSSKSRLKRSPKHWSRVGSVGRWESRVHRSREPFTAGCSLA